MIERPHETSSDEEPRSAIGARIDPDPKQPQRGASKPPTQDPLGVPSAPAYAGFWRRLAAYIVDSLIVGIPTVLIVESIGITLPDPTVMMAVPVEELAILLALVYGLQWPYFAGFEASPWQATPGKRLLQVIVTDAGGERLSFARASGRYFGKLISEAIFAIGYVMIAFTEKKQGLHDLMARTLVTKR